MYLDTNILLSISKSEIYLFNYDNKNKILPETIFPFGPCHWNDGSTSSVFLSC